MQGRDSGGGWASTVEVEIKEPKRGWSERVHASAGIEETPKGQQEQRREE
jgi:hypothetical protein